MQNLNKPVTVRFNDTQIKSIKELADYFETDSVSRLIRFAIDHLIQAFDNYYKGQDYVIVDAKQLNLLTEDFENLQKISLTAVSAKLGKKKFRDK